MRAAIAVVSAAAMLAACGPPCKHIIAQRSALKPGNADTARPHLQLVVPFDRLNVLLTRALHPMPSLKLNPAVSLLGMITGITVEARSVRVVPARKGYVGVRVDLGFAGDASPVTAMTVDLEVKPTVSRHGYQTRLVLGFGADTLRQVRPRFAKGVRERVIAAIQRRLPKVLRDRAPKFVLHAAAGKVMSFLSEQGFSLIRSQLLDRVGQLTTTMIWLPEAPIKEVRVSSVSYPQPSVRFDVYTSLAVVRGLDANPRQRAVGSTMRLRVANSTLTELANWAIRTGRLPKRYSDNMQPNRVGKYEPVLQWRHGHPRPLAIHVFRTEGECSYVLAGLKPTLKLKGDNFVASYSDRKYEAVHGNLLIKFGLWLKRWLAWFGYKGKKVAAATSVRVGKRRLEGSVTRARLGKHELVVDLGLEIAN